MQLAKILVVDDEPDLESLILQKFRSKIKAKEYEFHFAQNGSEALDKIANDGTIDLILTDINMPVMDGLTLLSKINELNNKLMKSIIVSAYGDMENIRTAMNRGAYDFITKPIDLKDLEITIEKSLSEINLYKQAMVSHNKLVALQQELDIATTIQTSILPKTFPAFPDRKEFDIYAKMIPAKEVGGDLYDFFLIDKYRLGVVIGDVSGKGIAAALLMAVCKTLIKATAYKGLPTDSVLFEVNNLLVDESPPNMFVTVFYGVLDTRNGAFEYANGGHNSPYLISNDGTTKLLDDVGGLLLGTIKSTEYQSNIIMLKPGESIFFYTDGVTEAFNSNEEDFKEERLLQSLKINSVSSAEKIVANVFETVKNFTNGVEQSDDITCLALKYLKR
ncbi:MAG: SpoIIE family protein phosphatase [Ignavibacteriota bacterium]|nr:MAG: response regulator [Chlorobiota bacterium]MBE7475909.1 SpoIIE family protein phosphatase [Ignavibacteriales bacterium]MBL1123283.1 response regulator [Ignavibacteriota bacterium]MCE7857344.1 response regulator [Ignavibacteria bacterium CHB3]MCZ7615104.1 SpoIIE family protein phosphatase [Ignavibacteriaceae bacterium]